MAKLKTESVKIPMTLLKRIISLLEYLCPDADVYDSFVIEDHGETVTALHNLEKSIELRNAFDRFINDCESDIPWESRLYSLNHESDLPF